jgi:hypothetical protein
MTWHTSWDFNPPSPGAAEWDEYLAALPAEATRLEQLYNATPPAWPLAALDGVEIPAVPLDEQRRLAETIGEAMRTPASLAEALGAAHAYLTRYVVCPSPHEPVAVVLWVAHAWAVDAAETSPYLAVTSVHKRSGKTRLSETVEQLVPRPWRAVTPSEAVLFRKLEQDRPTLLLDEVDAIFGTKRQAESHEGIRAILNAGNRRGTTVPRMVGEGRKMQVQDFATFGPKVLLGIGELPATIADRAIPVRLERRARSEPVTRFRIREAEPAAIPIREALEAHLAPLIDRLAHARPDIPQQLGDRAADGWEPLLAIADAAGDDWPARAQAAAVALSGERMDDLDDEPLSVLLLADIRGIFDRHATDKLMTAQLLEELARDDERPWGEWRDGKPITAHGLGRLLRGYKVRPERMRPGGRDTAQGRGYRRADFEPVWERYVPGPAHEPQSVTPSHGEPSHHDSSRSKTVAGDGVTVGPSCGRAGEGDLSALAERIFAPLGGRWTSGQAWDDGTPLPEHRPGPDDVDAGYAA